MPIFSPRILALSFDNERLGGASMLSDQQVFSALLRIEEYVTHKIGTNRESFSSGHRPGERRRDPTARKQRWWGGGGGSLSIFFPNLGG